MKKSYLYTIVFMFIISALFTLVLASANTALEERFNENALLAEEAALLEVFGLSTEGSQADLEARFAASIEAAQRGETEYFRLLEGGQVEAIALPFVGSGLWGTIRGWLAVDVESPEEAADGLSIRGIVFTEQNETPGLGGRIEEQWFKEQFRGLVYQPGQSLDYGPNLGAEIDAITGATQTSNAILRIINRVLAEELLEYEEVK
ncbi:MAG: FMN-binding protein [Eubacteriales bacterium]|nr:FMN-binding protein [Eubacteriales bacterium]